MIHSYHIVDMSRLTGENMLAHRVARPRLHVRAPT